MDAPQQQLKVANAQLQSPLGRLPPELRYIIYKHVLTFPETIGLRKAYVYYGEVPVRNELLLTCRLVLYEAETIFYRHNEFNMSSRQYKTTFVPSLGPVRLQAVTRLQFHSQSTTWHFTPSFILLDELFQLSNLKSIHMFVPSYTQWGLCDVSERLLEIGKVERWAANFQHLEVLKFMPEYARLPAEEAQEPLVELVNGTMIDYAQRWTRFAQSCRHFAFVRAKIPTLRAEMGLT